MHWSILIAFVHEVICEMILSMMLCPSLLVLIEKLEAEVDMLFAVLVTFCSSDHNFSETGFAWLALAYKKRLSGIKEEAKVRNFPASRVQPLLLTACHFVLFWLSDSTELLLNINSLFWVAGPVQNSNL